MPKILSDVALDQFNTLGLASRAARYCRVTSPRDLSELFNNEFSGQGPALLLGGGSNVVLRGDVAGLVVHMAIDGMVFHPETADALDIDVGAGVSWDALVRACLARGAGGLENLISIPGSVGAAPVQNIGAYGVELADRLAFVEVFDTSDGHTRCLTPAACCFGYRDSVFKQQPGRFIIQRVRMRLPRPWVPALDYGDLRGLVGSNPSPQRIAEHIFAIRAAKLPDPRVIGNVGSFFKNPLVSTGQYAELRAAYPQLVGYPQKDQRGVKLAAAWLIDAAGLKGAREGNAAVHDAQPLVLVNLGGASAADLLTLADRVARTVEQRFGVLLEREPVLI